MADFQTWTITEPYLNIHCALGEGPQYEPETNTLRFVDIKKHRLHTLKLGTTLASIEDPGDALVTLQLDMPVGVTSDIEGVASTDKILVGGKSGVAILDRKTGSYQTLKKYHDSDEKVADLRSNDGACDAHGRFWVGTMSDFNVGEFLPEGNLFCFDTDLSRRDIRGGLRIPNSVKWSPDNKILYFTNTTEGTVHAFDYEVSTGAMSNERIFYQHSGTGGSPDGFAVDEHGNIWHAVYGEGRVLKINQQGQLVGQINLPTNNITCPTFAGTELWITTAAEEDQSKTESFKNGGGLFKIDVGVRGSKIHKFRPDASLKVV
ncbi:calcium homeostasis protein [Phlyctema vagabunda]|uniref:Calcium homeostasis protein n=1 Tax=Phlyctema vagabunda TaxID=108571 RepID=A0ABR4PD68_9HELO